MFWFVEGKVSIARTQLALHHFKKFFKNDGWYEYWELKENSRLLLLSKKHANQSINQSINVKYVWIKIE